jgi:hypothetical protein
MNTAALDGPEQQAIRRALEYWIDHWDWECPTLFGIEKHELLAVLQTWPIVSTTPETTALAALGGLRELLHGASALPNEQIFATLGISFADAESLCKKTLALASQVLG